MDKKVADAASRFAKGGGSKAGLGIAFLAAAGYGLSQSVYTGELVILFVFIIMSSMQ